MIKIEATSLEEAYLQASFKLKCSVTKIQTEVIQYPSKGILGVFKKNAIIVATQMRDEDTVTKEDIKKIKSEPVAVPIPSPAVKEKKEITKRVENIIKKVTSIKKEKKESPESKQEKESPVLKEKRESLEPKQEKESSKKNNFFTMLNDTIMPASFVSTQDDEEEVSVDKDMKPIDKEELEDDLTDVAQKIREEINALFKLSCFKIDEIQVSIYDENTLFIEFKGEDSALLIGKEGYRYKALSYMLFNWINSKYQLQLRLEIAEFLKNQEESVSRYLETIYESVDKDGRAQTKILDGVLVQIALKELRDAYPDKYVAIRSTRDGLKYIIINEYHSNQ